MECHVDEDVLEGGGEREGEGEGNRKCLIELTILHVSRMEACDLRRMGYDGRSYGGLVVCLFVCLCGRGFVS